MADAALDLTLDTVVLTATVEQELDGLTQVLEDVTLDATIFRESSGASVNVILEGATGDLVFFKEIQAEVLRPLPRVTLESVVTLGVAPPPKIIGKIYNLTGKIHDNGGAILCFVGFPNRTIEWRVLEGLGTITPFTTYTDELGRASARFDAMGVTGHVVVGVAFVP